MKKPKAEKFPDVTTLSFANAHSVPINFDWSEGWTETWESYEAHRCEECQAVLTQTYGGMTHKEVDPESDCEGYLSADSGPMMNYYYPLNTCGGFDQDEAVKAIVDLPLCLVNFRHEDWGLALTGGGMDFNWEICEAFMRLGELPPLHFCRPPAMAGRGKSARDKWIIEG